MNPQDKELEDEEETKETYLNFVNQNLGYDFNNELFFDFQTLEQVYDTSERKTKKEVIKEVEKMIDEKYFEWIPDFEDLKNPKTNSELLNTLLAIKSDFEYIKTKLQELKEK